MSRSRSGYWIWFLEGVEVRIQMETRPANFCAKLVPSLNGANLSFINSVTGSVCRGNCSNILQDNTMLRFISEKKTLLKQCDVISFRPNLMNSFNQPKH